MKKNNLRFYICFTAFISMLFTSIVTKAQSKVNGFLERKALIAYVIGKNGLYERHIDVPLRNVDKIEEFYAYDKKNKNLYAMTSNSNVVILLDKETLKALKKEKKIKQQTGAELKASIDRYNSVLDNKFSILNDNRMRFIKDSTQKATEDSILKAKEVEKRKIKSEKLRAEYINTHKFSFLPLETEVYCTLCDKYIKRNSVFCYGIQNDTIYYLTAENGDLGLSYMEGHVSKISSSLMNDSKFLYHYNAFKDSLAQEGRNLHDDFPVLRAIHYSKYLDKLKQVAPFGYINDWGWTNDCSFLKFNCSYTNTSPKTIKYITVYFKLYNDVDDVRLVGSFKGTGPVYQWDTAKWNWDNSDYIVSGDASSMTITKVVLTYMNGKQQVVSGKYLQINYDEDKDTEDRSPVIEIPKFPATFPEGTSVMMKY